MARSTADLHVVPVDAAGSKPERRRSPDAQARDLLRKRRDLTNQLRRVEFDLFEHRRRKADERGQKPPLTLEQLAAAVDL